MAIEETNISQRIKLAGAETATKLLRNNRGLFYTLDAVPSLMAAFARGGLKAAKQLVSALRKVAAGLDFKGSSDLIGWTIVEITPEMVGKKLAVFTAVEVKTATGQESEDQAKFGALIERDGGIYILARSPEDFLNGMKNKFNKWRLTE